MRINWPPTFHWPSKYPGFAALESLDVLAQRFSICLSPGHCFILLTLCVQTLIPGVICRLLALETRMEDPVRIRVFCKGAFSQAPGHANSNCIAHGQGVEEAQDQQVHDLTCPYSPSLMLEIPNPVWLFLQHLHTFGFAFKDRLFWLMPCAAASRVSLLSQPCGKMSFILFH